MTSSDRLVRYREGAATFFAPSLEAATRGKSFAPSKLPVFFNPAMKLSRDFAVLAVVTHGRHVGRRLKVCEPMAGCGVRGIRIAREVAEVEKVVLADLNPRAYELISRNVRLNSLEKTIEVKLADANALLAAIPRDGGRCDYVDLDPAGSPAAFTENALRSTASGGLLAVTATDTAVLCGARAEACVKSYGAQPARTPYCREVGLRILLGFAAVTAARLDLAVNPMFCYAWGNYIRLIMQVTAGAKKATRCLSDMGWLVHCNRCLERQLVRGRFLSLDQRCPRCGALATVGGPLWVGGLWDQEFCGDMLKASGSLSLESRREVEGLLEGVAAETRTDRPYFVLPELGRLLGVQVPKLSFVLGGLEGRGYVAQRSIFDRQAFRTDAPVDVVRAIFLHAAEGQKE
ncbi:MAG: tRNA (guanine(10)-N(2))-dimethyltransferase [Aigarchaeota archaeon]|nr:tRNA (guanine(10)-N(2))-dimethyltransferase [Aigarchaeota archaeon]